MFDQLALQNYLRLKFAEMRKRNPSFSQRAFAKKLGLEAGTLSSILNAKRVVSRKIAENILNRIEGDPMEKADILKHFSKKPILKKATLLNDEEREVGVGILTLSEREFEKISTWTHYAILSLMKMKKFDSDPASISKRLGVSVTVARKSFEELCDAGLILQNTSGNWVRSKNRVKTSDDVSSKVLNNFHRNNLEYSKTKLALPVSVRDFTLCTFPADESTLPEAKMLVRRFIEDLSDLMETKNCSQVYQLGVQLFPLTVEGEDHA